MYELIKDPLTNKVNQVRKTEGNVYFSIPINPDNTDYQAYLAWVAEGNTPEGATE